MPVTTFTLQQAFRILRERGVYEMKVALPDLEITEGESDLWAVYSHKQFSICVDHAGNVVGGRENFELHLNKLTPPRRTGREWSL